MKQRLVVVVEHADDARLLPDPLVVSAERYLEGSGSLGESGLVVLNLCRTFRYGTPGYYVSLLAEARRQRVIPTIETTEGLGEPYGLFRARQEAGVATVDAAASRSLARPSVRLRPTGSLRMCFSARKNSARSGSAPTGPRS